MLGSVGWAPAHPCLPTSLPSSPQTGPAPSRLSPQCPPCPCSCLVLVQQQLENRLPVGEEADLLNDVHTVVHPHSLVQPPVICKQRCHVEQGWGLWHTPCPSRAHLHPPVPRKRTS